MMHCRWLIAGFLFLHLFSVVGQEKQSSRKKPRVQDDARLDDIFRQRLQGSKMVEVPSPRGLLNEEFVAQHNRRVLEWQHSSTLVVFVVVLFLVFVGVFFAALQFFGFGKAPGDSKSEGQDVPTEFSASLKGVSVKSPVLGVVLLGISLAFFFLYLKYVYTIAVVPLP